MAQQNVKQVSFMSPQAAIAPDIAAEQLNLQRQQQLADLLRQQSLQSFGPTEYTGGPYSHAVQRSPLEGFTKLGQAYLSGSMQEGLDKKNQELATAYQQKLAEMLDPNGARQAIPQSMASQAALQTGAANGSVGPTPQNAARMDALTQPQQGTQGSALNPMGIPAKLAAMLYSTDPGKFLEMQGKYYEPTSEIKNNNWMGITADQAKQFELAKRMKEGTMSFQPGQTNILPNNQRIVAPDFEKGIAGGFDAQGNPIAMEIPGSAAIAAGRAGAIKGAEQRATIFPNQTVGGRVGVPVWGGDIPSLGGQQQAGVPQGQGGVGPVPLPPANGPVGVMKGQLPLPERPQGMQTTVNTTPTATTSAPQFGSDPMEMKRQEASLSLNKDSMSALRKEAEAQQGILNTLTSVESLINAGTLGNSPKDRLKMTGHDAGVYQSPQTINTANLMKLGNQLVLARGSLGAGVSVSDAERYDKAAGDFTRAKSNAERLAYIKIMREVAQKVFGETNRAINSFESTGKLPAYGTNNQRPPLGAFGNRPSLDSFNR